MADVGGVNINKGKIGANIVGNDDAISGMLIESVAASGLPLNTTVPIYSLKDAENLGITEAFDLANVQNVYRHIREFFRISGEGVKLYIKLIARDTTAVVALTDSTPTANDSLAKQMIVAANYEIRQASIIINPINGPYTLNGLNSDIYAAIPLAQAVHNWTFDNYCPVSFLLEGRDFSGTAAAAQDLRDILSVDAPKVSIVIGQDWNYAEGLPLLDSAPPYLPFHVRNFADVGTALGTVSAAAINQNIGDNETFNLTDSTKGAWLIPGLSNHVKNKDQYNDLQTLEDKGYIFGIEYAGMEGVRWNNDHTCVEIIVDSEGNINEHTIAYGRTLDKAVRLLRSAYLPKVKTKQPIDPTTGLLPPGVVKYFDGIGDDVFGQMIAAGEITEGVTTVDPNSDLLVAKILNIGFRIVPYGNVGEIIGTINLKTTIN